MPNGKTIPMKAQKKCSPCRESNLLVAENEGRYANNFRVGYNKFEFVLDFGQCFDEQENEQFHTRIVASPEYVKLLSDMLIEAIVEYKKNDCFCV